jgi:hypothetical protein
MEGYAEVFRLLHSILAEVKTVSRKVTTHEGKLDEIMVHIHTLQEAQGGSQPLPPRYVVTVRSPREAARIAAASIQDRAPRCNHKQMHLQRVSRP